jgi:hypothetical protein
MAGVVAMLMAMVMAMAGVMALAMAMAMAMAGVMALAMAMAMVGAMAMVMVVAGVMALAMAMAMAMAGTMKIFSCNLFIFISYKMYLLPKRNLTIYAPGFCRILGFFVTFQILFRIV